VNFANDGSVSAVTVASPFTGTATGACVADALAAAHVVPFTGPPGVVEYRFSVGPKPHGAAR
jgi:hypothetical protein